jgi:hypothetical protein
MNHGRRRALRFTVALAVIALIAALPSLAGARSGPHDSDVTAAALLTAVAGSESRGYSGYAESAGSAAIPDVTDLGAIPSLLGDVTKLRVWWSGPQQWRVDTLTDADETDTYAHPGGTWVWSSAAQTAVDIAGGGVRFLRAADLTPDQLGRAFAGLRGRDITASRDGARRIAGRTALGVVLRPAASSVATTVDDVQLWVDETTGVALAVSITPVGQSEPLLSTMFLSFRPDRPQDSTDTFIPPDGATVQHVSQTSPGAILTRLRPLPQASQAAGLVLGDDLSPGLAVYRAGLAQVVAVGLDRGDADTVEKELGSAATVTTLGGARVYRVSTPLIDLALFDVRGLHVVVAGTVPQATLTSVFTALAAAPRVFAALPAVPRDFGGSPGFAQGPQ